MLSALAHGGSHPQRHQVLAAFLASLQGLEPLDQDRAEVYHDIVGAVLPKAEARSRIISCTDLAQLDTWLRRAVNAESIGDLFRA